MICAVCSADNGATAQACAQCGAALATACPGCAAVAPVGARFCPACGTALSSPAKPGGNPGSEVGKPGAGERKQVTILFADFSGFTSFAAALDPEDLHERMQSLWRKLDAIIVARGGVPEKHSGDAIMAVFGGWQAREEDPAEAIRAALEMQTWLSGQNSQAAGTALQLRIGIHTGLVVVGPADHSGEFLATGDAVNLACRLEQSAPVGGVLISGATYRHVFGFFDAQAQPPLMVKGKSEPVDAFLILRAKSRGLALQMRGVEGVVTEMIGRQAEMQQLQRVFNQVMEQRVVRAIAVVAEGGVGKSRLLREFQKWIDLLPESVRLFCGRATTEITSLPFALIRDLFATRFEIQESDAAAVAREKFVRGLTELVGAGDAMTPEARAELLSDIHFFGQLLGWDFSASPQLRGIIRDVEQVQHRALRGLNRLLAAIHRYPVPRPSLPVSAILLVVEDLHWADDGSLDLLEHLARNLAGVPLLILGSARPAFLERRPVWQEGRPIITPLPLLPLSGSESAALVKTILAKAPELPPALKDLITDAAEGNPFYIEEMINMLIDQRVILPAAESWHIELARLADARVPATLTGVLQARLDGLLPAERAVLQRAAVVGRVFWDRTLEFLGPDSRDQSAPSLSERVISRTELEPALQGLRQKELIHRRETSAFAGAAEYSFKHELLRNVAYESLLKKSRRLHHARIAAWLMESCGDRVGEFAGLVATHFELAARPAEAAEWHGRAGTHAQRGYAPALASDHFQKAIQLLPRDAQPESERQSKLLTWQEGRGETLGAQAQFTAALETYAAMRDLAQQLAQPLAEARAWNGMAFLHERNGDNRASIECAERAEALAARAADAGVPEKIRALHFKGWACYRLADAPAVLALGKQTLELCAAQDDRRGSAVSYKLLGVAHLQLGYYAEADSFFQRGLELFQEWGDRRNTAAMWSNRGETARALGDYQKAVDLYAKALAIAREIGHRESEWIYRANLGAARVGLKQFVAAEADLRAVINQTGSANSCTLAEVYSFLSEACLGQARLAEAIATAQLAIRLAKESENPLFLGGAWRALGLCGATAMHPGGAAVPEKLDPTLSSAAECFAESLRVFEEINAEGEQARTLRAWGEHEFGAGQIESAREKLSQARSIFLRLGATCEVANTDSLLCGQSK